MRNSERGFTLVEVVAAIALLAIVAIPLANIFTDSFRFQARSQKNTEINEVAQFIAEQLKDGKNYYGIDEIENFEGQTKMLDNSVLSELTDLTDTYEIEILGIRSDKGENISGSTPEEFAYEIITDGNTTRLTENETLEHYGLAINCSNFVITTSENDYEEGEYNILIHNISTEKEATFQVNKRTPSKLNIYTKGSMKVNLQGYPENRKPKKYTTFEKFHLGDKDNVSSKSEDLYNVKITVTSLSNRDFTTSIDTTFVIQREEKGVEEDL